MPVVAVVRVLATKTPAKPLFVELLDPEKVIDPVVLETVDAKYTPLLPTLGADPVIEIGPFTAVTGAVMFTPSQLPPEALGPPVPFKVIDPDPVVAIRPEAPDSKIPLQLAPMAEVLAEIVILPPPVDWNVTLLISAPWHTAFTPVEPPTQFCTMTLPVVENLPLTSNPLLLPLTPVMLAGELVEGLLMVAPNVTVPVVPVVQADPKKSIPVPFAPTPAVPIPLTKIAPEELVSELVVFKTTPSFAEAPPFPLPAT